MLSTPEPLAVTEAAPRKVILIVEDDETNAEVLVRETPFLVCVAADAKAAW